MSHLAMYNPFISNAIPDLTGLNVLDCGCGRGIWGYLMRINNYGNKAFLVGLDCTSLYLKFSKEHKVYDDLVKGDVAFLPFRSKSFGFVLASEVIEHLQKVDGIKSLDGIERVSSGNVVITTPQGFWPQGSLSGIEAETHKSTWSSSDFKKRGYSVNGIGCRFLKYWLGGKSLPIYMAFLYFFTPFSWLMPLLAEYLIAKKKIQSIIRTHPPTYR